MHLHNFKYVHRCHLLKELFKSHPAQETTETPEAWSRLLSLPLAPSQPQVPGVPEQAPMEEVLVEQPDSHHAQEESQDTCTLVSIVWFHEVTLIQHVKERIPLIFFCQCNCNWKEVGDDVMGPKDWGSSVNLFVAGSCILAAWKYYITTFLASRRKFWPPSMRSL